MCETCYFTSDRIVLGICMLVSAAAEAQQAPSSWSLGVGALVASEPYRDVDQEVLIIPAIRYEGERFYLRTLQAGYRLLSGPVHSLDVTAFYNPTQFDPQDSEPLSQLDKRRASVMAGLEYRYQQPWGTLTLTAATDASGRHQGQLGELRYGYTLTEPASRWRLTPSVGMVWSSHNYTNYYYGVSAEGSARSGIPSYTAGTQTNAMAMVAGGYRIDNHWMVNGLLRYTRLDDEIQDSPMIDQPDKMTAVLTLAYGF